MIESNLKQRLLVLRGTLKRAIAFNGLGRLAVLLVASVFLALFFDYFFFRWERPVNTVFRVMMLAGFVGGIAWILYYKLIAPLTVPLDTDDMALAVEKEFPKLNDSLISTMQLTRMLNTDGSVSQPMVDEVARQAHAEASTLDFTRVVKFDRIKPVLIAGAASLALFVLLLAIPPSVLHTRDYLTTALWRLVNPFANTPYPVRTKIAVKGNEEINTPRNEALRIIAEVSGDIPETAYIQFYSGGRMVSKEPITTVRTNVDLKENTKTKEFEYEYNPVQGDFEYVVFAGDNQSAPHKVHAVDRPAVQNIEVVYEYPSYITDKKSDPERKPDLNAVVGTKATLRVMANKPLANASIKLGDAQPESIDSFAFSSDKKTFTRQIDLDVNKEYELFLTDTEGFDNGKVAIRHRITANPDKVPDIKWRNPGIDLEVTPNAIVSLALNVTDDHGIQKALIKFKRFHMITPPTPAGGQNAPHPVIDTSTPAQEDTFDFVGEYGRSVKLLDLANEWALSEMNLQPNDLIEYWAEAYDWCPTKRKQPEIELHRLKILSTDQLITKLDILRMRLVEDLITIIRMEESDKRQVHAISGHLELGNPFDITQRGRVGEAASMQEEIRHKTVALQKGFDDLVKQYHSNGLDAPDETARLRDVSDQLAIEHTQKMPDATKIITKSSTLKEEPARVAQLKTAEVKQTEILDDLNRLLAMMQKWQETEELLRMTRELLAKQRVVTADTIPFKEKLGAKQPTDASKDELNEVKGLEHKQRDCAVDMKNLFTRMTMALAKMQSLDKFVAKNIEDSIRVAQNTDATKENGELTTTGDTSPGIEDKMTAAQADIAKFNFGTANGKQKASEVALQTIITYLSRRRDIDSKTMKELEEMKKLAQQHLDDQRKLNEKTAAIKSADDLQKELAQMKQQLNDLKQRETDIRKQTQELNGKSNADADRLQAELDDARKNLETLIAEETGIRSDTEGAMSPPEINVARGLNSLEEIEAFERELAKSSDTLDKNTADKIAGEELKKATAAIVKMADDQADTRQKLDNIAAQLADVVRNGAAENKPDAKAAAAGAAATKGIPILEASAKDMAEAADTLRQGAPFANKVSLAKAGKLQLSAADKIAQARALLKDTSGDMAKDKKDEHAKTGEKQSQTEGKAKSLAEKLGKLGAEIDKSHAESSGKLDSKADASGAAAKVGEAAGQMGKAKDELKKPDPASAAGSENKALAAMGEAQKKIDDMQRKVDEIKDHARFLERVQKEVKDETRKVADEMKKVEDQLPLTQVEPKAQDNLKKAGDSMQNAQSSLSNAKSGENKQGGNPSNSGKQGDGKQGDGKQGDDKKGDNSKQGDNNNKGGDPEQAKKDAEKHEDNAISELDAALNKIDELAAKAKAEGDQHQAKALARAQQEQLAQRESVQRLQPRIQEMETKTGNEKASRAAKSNESAAQRQSKASSQMGKGNQSQSQQDQKEAEQDLQDVLDNLDDLQKEMKQQQQKEQLFQIEQELRKMLDIQNDISKRTRDADKLNAGRPKKLTLIEIFKNQLALADSTKVIVKKLEEAPAFQFVLQESVEDMTEAATRLDKENAGTGTQEIQDDAAKKISDLIEALRKERTQSPPKQGGGKGGGKSPLVPPLAQMKMLLIMQKDVDKRVKRLDGEVTAAKNPEMNRDQKDQLRRAAEVQGKISRVMQKTAEQFEGSGDPPPKPEDGGGN